jgi:hypothetical protein
MLLAAFEVGVKANMVVEDGDVAGLVGDLGTGKVPNGLARGASSLEGVVEPGRGATFFSELAFAGLPTMLLNMLEVFDPLDRPESLFDLDLRLGFFNCDSCSSLS